MNRALSTLIALAMLGASACSRDLNIPPEPGTGEVTGSIDTQGYAPRDNQDVALVDDRGERRVQKTNAAGEFHFTEVSPGTYFLEVNVPGFASLVKAGVRVEGGLTFAAGQLRPAWLANTPQEAVVTGKVVINGDGSAAGGQVEFFLQPADQRIALAAIGLDGTFVQRVVPGTYKLRASHPLFVTKEVADIVAPEGQQVDLSESPVTMDIDPATVNGTVLRERDGQEPAPAEGALVTLGNGYTTTVDATGAFQLQGLSGGPQTLRVSLAGHHDTLTLHPFTLRPGETTTVEPITLALDRGSISGTVTLADQQPAREITVALGGTTYSVLAVPDTAQPATARYLVSGVPVGTYELQVTKTRYARAVVNSVAVSAGGVTALQPITLTVLRGDFQIDDGVATNTAGYARTREVTLDLTDWTTAVRYRASEDPEFTGVAFAALVDTTPAFQLADADGTRTVYAQYEDASNVRSAVFSATVVLDRVAPSGPTLRINDGAAFTKVPNPLVLTLDAQEPLDPGVDAVSGVASVLLAETGAVDADGRLVATPVPYQRTIGFTRASSSDGPQGVYAQFLDHAGNATAVVSGSIVIDTVPPNGGLSIARGERATVDGYTSTPLVSLLATADAEPNGGFVSIRLANRQQDVATATLQPVRSQSAWFIEPGLTGPRTVHAQLVDAAGNPSIPLQAEITYDATPPSPVTAALVGTSPTRANPITLALSAADDALLSPTQALTLSENPLLQDATPVAFPAGGTAQFTLSTDQGAKTVWVRVRDAAGNDATTTVMLVRDSLPPTGSFVLEGALADGTLSTSVTTTSAVTLRLSQEGASRYLVGDSTLSACPDAASYLPLAGATLPATLTGTGASREVRLCLADAAGNVLGPLSDSIDFDAAPPANCALALSGRTVGGDPAPGGLTARAQVDATLAGCDVAPYELALSPYPMTCTATAPVVWQRYTTTTPVVLGAEGANVIYACVRDVARNTTAAQEASMTLDTQPPANPRVTVHGGAAWFNRADYVAAANTRTVAVQGVADGAATWRYGEDTPSTGATYGVAGSVVLAGEGLRSVAATFTDAVGNTSSVVSDTVQVDTVAPYAPAVTLASGARFTNSVSVKLAVATADAFNMRAVEDTTLGSACASSDLTPIPPVAYRAEQTFLLASGEGTKRVCVDVADAAGNVSPVASAQVVLDTLAPSGSLSIARGPRATLDGYTNSTLVTVVPAVTAEPNGGSVQLRLGNSAAEAAVAPLQPVQPMSWTIAAGAPGTRTVFAELVDAAGNVTTGVQAGITYDGAPPTGVGLALVGASPTRENPISLTVTATDSSPLSPTEGLTLSEDASFGGAAPMPFPAGNTPFTLSAAQGVKTVYARVRDAAGNDTTTSLSLTYDTLPPEVKSWELAGSLADGTRSTTVTTTASADFLITSDGATRYATGGSEMTACPALTAFSALPATPIPVTLSGTGATREAKFCLADAAGNVAGPYADSIGFDAAAPLDCALALAGYTVEGGPAPAGFTARPQVDASLTGCSDTPKDIVLSRTPLTCTAGAPLSWEPYAAPMPFLLAGIEGTNPAYACVRDAARNTTSAALGTITLDNLPPANPRVIAHGGAEFFSRADYLAAGGTRTVVVQGLAGGAATWSVGEDAPAGSYASGASASVLLAGEGTRKLAATFTDAVGNTSGVVTDTVVVDTVVPVPAGVELNGGYGYLNAMSVRLAARSLDAATMRYVEDTTPASPCTSLDLAAITPEPFRAEVTLLLSPGDGLKQVCLDVADAAGNVSPVSSATIVVDMTPPSAPQITTPPQIGNWPDGTEFVVQIATPSTDANFLRYDIIGGKDTQWVPITTPPASTLSFTFRLASYASAVSGAPNTLRIRAVDRAGNNTESYVVITTDIVAPAAVTQNGLYVMNGDRQATVLWKPSTSPDVAGHQIHYGSSTGVYGGQYAQQGPSPVSAGPESRFTLSGLVNGAVTYVQVKAVDRAGNVSGVPIGAQEVSMQPNDISPTQVAAVPIGVMNRTNRLVVAGDVAYVAGAVVPVACSGAGLADTAMIAVDLSTLVSPIQGGQILDPPPPPLATSAVYRYSDGLTCESANRKLQDLVIDGHLAFLASGTRLRIYSLAEPMAPALLATLDFAAPIYQVAIRGDRLFLTRNNGDLVALSLAKLFDGDPATFPTTADTLGSVSWTSTVPPGGLVLSRDRLIVGQSNYGSASVWNATPVLDDDGATTWANSDRVGNFLLGNLGANPVVSGDLMYVSNTGGLKTLSMAPIWAGGVGGTALVDIGMTAGGQLDLQGPHVFMGDQGAAAAAILDFTERSLPIDAVRVRPANNVTPGVVAVYGNYLVGGTGTAVAVFEIATPWTPHIAGRLGEGAPWNALRGAFLRAGGNVFDLQAGWPPPNLGGRQDACTYDGATLDDYDLYANASQLRILPVDDAVDRDPATAHDAADLIAVNMPAGQSVRAVETIGNLLILLEGRADGMWIEAFDARTLRDRNPATAFSLSPSLGAVRVTPEVGHPKLVLSKSRAFITLGVSSANQGLYAVDLRDLLDDDPATALDAADLQGFVGPPSLASFGTRGLAVRGNYAYVAHYNLEVYDVSNALDDDPLTVIDGTVPHTSFNLGKTPESVEVFGSYAVLNSSFGPLFVLDVSSPLAPVVMGSLPFSATSYGCNVDPSTYESMRTQVTVAGSRAYVSSLGALTIVELE